MNKLNKCLCIKDTTLPFINVGNYYKWEYKNSCYQIIYNETEKTFEKVYGNYQWFKEHFKTE